MLLETAAPKGSFAGIGSTLYEQVFKHPKRATRGFSFTMSQIKLEAMENYL